MRSSMISAATAIAFDREPVKTLCKALARATQPIRLICQAGSVLPRRPAVIRSVAAPPLMTSSGARGSGPWFSFFGLPSSRPPQADRHSEPHAATTTIGDLSGSTATHATVAFQAA